MKPDFALLLSFEGIRLLRRSPEGWAPLGEVPLDSRDLGGDLAALRAKGLGLDPSWRGTMILLPPEQVRTLTLDNPEASEAEVRAALDGATPYEVEDLVFDSAARGPRTFVAAVARETLDEAEAFAAEHGFQPVAFGAVLPEGTYPGEASFGDSKLAFILDPQSGDAAPKPAAGAPPSIHEPSRAAEAAGTAALPQPDAGEAPPPVPLPPLAEPEAIVASRARPLRGVSRDDGGPAETAKAASPARGAKAEPTLGPAPAAIGAASPRGSDRAPSKPLAVPLPRTDFGTPQPPPRPDAAPPVAAGRAKAGRAEPTGEAGRETALGTRGQESPRSGGKPRFLGLILTVILLVVMAAVAVMAAVGNDGIAGLWGEEAETPAIEVAVASPLPVAEPASAGASVRPNAEDAQAAASAVASAIAALPDATPAGTAVSPAEADRIYAATGVWLREPRLPLVPDAEALVLAVAEAETAGPPETPPVLPSAAPEPPFARPADPPSPGAEPARGEDGLILAAAEGTPTPEGAMIVAGPPSVVPPTRPGAVAGEAPAADPAAFLGDGAELANAMAGPPALRPRLRPDDPDLPEGMAAAPGTEGDAPSTLAFATEADASADGAATPGGVSLDGLRPAPRPEGLAPEEAAEPEVLASFDGPRPGLRPAGIAPEAPAEDPAAAAIAEALANPMPAPEAAPAPPPAPDLQSTLAAIVQNGPDPLAGATPRAVAVARVPDSRPRNFDRVVRDQLARAARAAQPRQAAQPQQAAAQQPARGNLQPNEQAESEPEVASSAAAAPSGVTPGGVAQAATFADAMALREINLIGVYGQPSDRRALVRLGNGRYLRVGVGDSLDGGQVTAIGDNALNYTKRGRTQVLVIPGG